MYKHNFLKERLTWTSQTIKPQNLLTKTSIGMNSSMLVLTKNRSFMVK